MRRSNGFTVAFVALLTAVIGCGGGGGGKNPVQPPPGGGSTNHPPTVNLNISDTHLGYNGTANVSVTASDVDGDQVSFTWTAELGTVTTSGPTATNVTFTAGQQWGQAKVTVTASDGKGGTAQATALTYIRNPNPPSVTLEAIASQCGADAFGVRATFGENVLVTSVYAGGFDSYGQIYSCSRTSNYSPAIVVNAGTPFTLRSDQGTNMCVWRVCGGVTYERFFVTIRGTRPEPDGGSWMYTRSDWYRP